MSFNTKERDCTGTSLRLNHRILKDMKGEHDGRSTVAPQGRCIVGGPAIEKIIRLFQDDEVGEDAACYPGNG
jgi:hypothetical protein